MRYDDCLWLFGFIALASLVVRSDGKVFSLFRILTRLFPIYYLRIPDNKILGWCIWLGIQFLQGFANCLNSRAFHDSRRFKISVMMTEREFLKDRPALMPLLGSF